VWSQGRTIFLRPVTGMPAMGWRPAESLIVAGPPASVVVWQST